MRRKLKIALISDAVHPTMPDGGHGLGMSAHAAARGLAERGHDVTLYAKEGSLFLQGVLMPYRSERLLAEQLSSVDSAPYDVWFDFSHWHLLSKEKPDWPILNRIGDLECDWTPPNSIVTTPHMCEQYPGAKMVKMGIKINEIPFTPEPSAPNYLVFMSRLHEAKGYHEARAAAFWADTPLRIGQGLKGQAKWDLLGGALGLLHPTKKDAGPRLPLEAAAAGCPTIVINRTGAPYHVQHCVSGFICKDDAEMRDAISDLHLLDRRAMREWVIDTHPFERMIDGYEQHLIAVADGERWQ